MHVDTHTHVVAEDEERYPIHDTGMTGPWWHEEPTPIERLLALQDDAGVDRTVVVQAMSAYGTDNSYCLDAVAAHRGRATSVVVVDQKGDDPAGALRGLVARGARGLRWIAFGDTTFEEPRALWDAVGALGLPVVLMCLADRLGGLHELVPSLPRVPMALDHCGFVELSRGIPEELSVLAEHPNLHVKVSTNALMAAEAGGDPAEFVTDLAARFGASRLMWGSDYPQTHHAPYADLVEYGRKAAAKLTDDDRAWFLGATALTIWPELA